MRFRFLGGSDAPDWILAEVSILAKMSSVRMKLICRQVLQQLTGKGVAYDKVAKLTSSARIQLDVGDLKALIATLHFIFASAAKYAVVPHVLLMELEQLGLPKDICTAIVREYTNTQDELRAHLLTQTLSLPQVTDAEWRVDYSIASSALQSVDAASVRLRLHLNQPRLGSTDPSIPLEMTADQFKLLYAELRTARQVMETLQT